MSRNWSYSLVGVAGLVFGMIIGQQLSQPTPSAVQASRNSADRGDNRSESLESSDVGQNHLGEPPPRVRLEDFEERIAIALKQPTSAKCEDQLDHLAESIALADMRGALVLLAKRRRAQVRLFSPEDT